MKRIQFNTGRLYQKDGQHIVAVEDDDGFIWFQDHSRFVWGKLTHGPSLNQQSVMKHYDNGHYDLCRTPADVEILLGLDYYHADPDYEYNIDWALKYPLMYALPGTRHENYIRLLDDPHLHLHMCVVDINTGHIWHAAKVGGS